LHISQILDKKGEPIKKNETIEIGIDLVDYQQNFEWDIMSVPARRLIKNKNIAFSSSTPSSSSSSNDIELSFKLTIRRKTLFYSFNIVIPLVGVSSLILFVFYLPAESFEKLTLSTFIVVSITFFVPLLYESLPPTSLQVPLIAKYTIFSTILVSLSILASTIVLNLKYRSNATHIMSTWMRKLFLKVLPRVICLNRIEEKYKDRGTFMTSIDFFKRYSTRRILCGNFKMKKTNLFLTKNLRLNIREQMKISELTFEMKQKIIRLKEKKRVSLFSFYSNLIIFQRITIFYFGNK